MSKITITLELTTEELLKVAKVLNTSPEAHTEPSAAKQSVEVQTPTQTVTVAPGHSKPLVPNAPKPGGKKAARLPAFGRSQEQIDEFINHEQSRVAKLDEAALLKQQREEEKAAREAIETAAANKVLEEVTAKPAAAPMPPKLWSL